MIHKFNRLPHSCGVSIVGPTVQADAKFLRRVFLGLVLLTMATGMLAGITTVQAMTDKTGSCILLCQ